MKKTSLLAVSGLLALALAGCSAAGGSGESTTAAGESKETDSAAQSMAEGGEGQVLRLSGLDGGYKKSGWEAVAAEFEKETGIKVELTLEKNIGSPPRPTETVNYIWRRSITLPADSFTMRLFLRKRAGSCPRPGIRCGSSEKRPRQRASRSLPIRRRDISMPSSARCSMRLRVRRCTPA